MLNLIIFRINTFCYVLLVVGGIWIQLQFIRGRPEPATSYQKPTTYQQFGSGTGSGSAIKFSGLVPILAEKYRYVAGLTNKLSVKPAICCWFRLCFWIFRFRLKQILELLVAGSGWKFPYRSTPN